MDKQLINKQLKKGAKTPFFYDNGQNSYALIKFKWAALICSSSIIPVTWSESFLAD
jgi:hypothetical protein